MVHFISASTSASTSTSTVAPYISCKPIYTNALLV